mgnify:CR=1 FL=1
MPSVTCWGSGNPLREFLHSDDLGDALVFLMERYSEEQFINVGSGQELTIGELATTVARIVGYPGTIHWDPTQPDGTRLPRGHYFLRAEASWSGGGHAVRTAPVLLVR